MFRGPKFEVSDEFEIDQGLIDVERGAEAIVKHNVRLVVGVGSGETVDFVGVLGHLFGVE